MVLCQSASTICAIVYTIQFPVLISHIIAGFIALCAALLTGVVAFTAQASYLKNHSMRTLHMDCWVIHTFATLWIGLSGFFLALAAVPINLFLFTIALFTLYMSLSGYLSLIQRGAGTAFAVMRIAILIVGIAMIMLGIVRLAQGNRTETTLILFGSIALGYGISDIYIKAPDNRKRFLARSLGAVIATVTAFLVVNVDLPPSTKWIVWIAPTILITPLIVYLIKLVSQSGKEDTTLLKSVSSRLKWQMRHLFEKSNQ